MTARDSATLAEAKRLASLGWRTFPTRAGAKTPLPGLAWKSEASTDPERLAAWFAEGVRNVAIPCPEGVVVLDVDPDGLAEFGDLAEAGDGPMVRTPRGGLHVYYSAPEGVVVTNSAGQLAPGVDVRTEGGYVVGPPSQIGGVAYQWVRPLTVRPGDLPPCPGWLADRLRAHADRRQAPRAPAQAPPPRSSPDRESAPRHPCDKYGSRALAGECEKIISAQIGTRNSTLNTSALKVGQLVAGGELDEAEARGALLDAARAAGLPEAEAAATIGSGMGEGLKHPRTRAARETRTGENLDTDDTDLRTDAGGDDEGGKASLAELCVRLVKQCATLGQSPKREAFAVLHDGPNVAHMLNNGGQLGDTIAHQFRHRYGRILPAGAYSDAKAALRGEALTLDPTPLALRVAEREGGVVIDLGTSDGAAVVADAGGWRIVDRSPCLFTRNGLTGELPRPVRGGDLGELWALLNVAEADRPLVAGWLVAAMIETCPHPVLMLGGMQGTGKSSAARMLLGLIDPSDAPLRSVPRDPEAFAVGAANSWAVCFDNVSSIPDWLSDALCKGVTGDGLVRRKLYSDNDVAVLAYKRAFVLTSIDAGAMRGDLGERSMIADLEPITPERRRTERELDALYQAARPRIFGALLDLLVQALAGRDLVQLDQMHRLADFSRVLAAIDEARGTDSLGLFMAQSARVAKEVVHGDSVGESLLSYARHRSEFVGSASDVMDMLRPSDRPRDWPASPREMAARLKRLAPALAGQGVIVHFPKPTDRPRHYRIDLSEASRREEEAVIYDKTMPTIGRIGA